MSNSILVTGATGKQGGAVVDALYSITSGKFDVLAVTRNTSSAAAKALTEKHPALKLVQGDLDDVPTLFANALKAAGGPIWGVYSVQISMGKGVTKESEITQGNNLINESVKNGVKHFVYSSVDRGGDERSWSNETPIPHFQSKYLIELYLNKAAGDSMGWTILRPVAFMDNLVPGFPTSVFLTAMRDTLQGKSVQWIATSDIGVFAAKAFADPKKWNHKAVGLAGDELTFDELSEAFQSTTGSQAGTTFGFLGSFLKYMVTEMGIMLDWFGSDGYGANISALKKEHPELLSMKEWIQEKSDFKTVSKTG